VVDELVFIAGPVLVTFLSTTGHTTSGLVTAFTLAVAGGLLFAAQVETEPPPSGHHPHRGPGRRFDGGRHPLGAAALVQRAAPPAAAHPGRAQRGIVGVGLRPDDVADARAGLRGWYGGVAVADLDLHAHRAADPAAAGDRGIHLAGNGDRSRVAVGVAAAGKLIDRLDANAAFTVAAVAAGIATAVVLVGQPVLDEQRVRSAVVPASRVP